MPAVPEWDVLLRGGVLRALGQRGCRSGWTVSNFRGRARLHITARAGDGHRKQLLLPYPWESDQLEAIRDGVVTVYEAFQNGAPLELSIAELSTAKAEAEARRQAEAMASQPSNLQQSVPSPATASRPISIDWAGLIRRYQQHKLRSGEIKETTWERLYKPRMALVLKTAKGPPAARDATQLLEAQADLWSQRPGCRTRRLQIQYTAALLRWAASQKLLPAQWAPPPDLSTIIGRSRESRAFTTPIAVPDILAMCRPSQTRAGGLPFNCSAPLVCDPKSCSICSFARGGSGALMKRLPLAAKPSPGPCGCCPVTNGPRNGSSSKPLIRQSSRPCELASARIPSVATCCGETTGNTYASSTKPREKSWCSIPAGTVTPTGPT